MKVEVGENGSPAFFLWEVIVIFLLKTYSQKGCVSPEFQLGRQVEETWIAGSGHQTACQTDSKQQRAENTILECPSYKCKEVCSIASNH